MSDHLPNPLIRIERAMPNYRIVLEVDEKWFQAIENFTDDVYEGELLKWVNVERIGE